MPSCNSTGATGEIADEFNPVPQAEEYVVGRRWERAKRRRICERDYAVGSYRRGGSVADSPMTERSNRRGIKFECFQVAIG